MGRVVVFCALMFGFFLFVMSSCKPRYDTPSSSQFVCPSVEVAYLRSQDFVKQHLRAPASAQFPNVYRDPEIRASKEPDCTFTILAYVDAQNGFGAMLRVHYIAKVQRTPEGWQKISVELIEN